MKFRHLAATLLAIFILSGVRGLPARWSNPRLFSGTLLEATYNPSVLRSLQPISIVLTGVASNTATTSPTVIAANSVLIWQGASSDDASPLNLSHQARGTITSGTTVTANRGSASSNATYNAVLVEFPGAFVKSQGCSTIAIADGTFSNTSAALSPAVVVAKTLVALTGMTNTYTGASNTAGQFLPRLDLTNTTTITATRQRNDAQAVSLVAGYCYIEFK